MQILNPCFSDTCCPGQRPRRKGMYSNNCNPPCQQAVNLRVLVEWNHTTVHRYRRDSPIREEGGAGVRHLYPPLLSPSPFLPLLSAFLPFFRPRYGTVVVDFANISIYSTVVLVEFVFFLVKPVATVSGAR